MKQLLITILLTILLTTVTSFTFGLEQGDKAVKFVNPDLTTKYFFSKDILGKGWVILDFFATDCEGCKKELPELEELYEEFKDLGVVIIVFALDEEGPGIVKPWFKEHPTDLTVLIDRYKKTAINYEVDEIPAVFLINPEGIIVFKRVEYSEKNVPEIKAILTKALKPEEEIIPDDETATTEE